MANQHVECKYCDGGSYPIIVEGSKICPSCNAEWTPVLCDDDEDFDLD